MAARNNPKTSAARIEMITRFQRRNFASAPGLTGTMNQGWGSEFRCCIFFPHVIPRIGNGWRRTLWQEGGSAWRSLSSESEGGLRVCDLRQEGRGPSLHGVEPSFPSLLVGRNAARYGCMRLRRDEVNCRSVALTYALDTLRPSGSMLSLGN